MIRLTGVKSADAIHTACAIIAKCDYLVTTDDRLLKYHNENISLIDPIGFIKKLEVKIMTETKEYTDNGNTVEILNEGIDCLRQRFGDVGTEVFISLIIREKFDYTKWRRQYFGDKSVEEINNEAAEYSRNHPFKPEKQLISI